MFSCCCTAEVNEGSVEVSIKPIILDDQEVQRPRAEPSKIIDRGDEKEAPSHGTYTVVLPPNKEFSALGIEVDEALALYDRVIAVGDLVSDGPAIAAKLREPLTNEPIILTLRRPQQIYAHLFKPGSLGMKLNYKFRSVGASISELSPDGLVAKWNQEHPDEKVEIGDRILELNSMKHLGPELIERLQNRSKMILTVLKF
mmetsp:Transcript_50493/g.110151  ORF Transcript_50493/g.110151 Transcript_50493/m.110151 type:complete len:200 (+) Transcript_50493:38-637(+)